MSLRWGDLYGDLFHLRARWAAENVIVVLLLLKL